AARFEPAPGEAGAEGALDACNPKEPAGLLDAAAALGGELDDDSSSADLADEAKSDHAVDDLPDGLSPHAEEPGELGLCHQAVDALVDGVHDLEPSARHLELPNLLPEHPDTPPMSALEMKQQRMHAAPPAPPMPPLAGEGRFRQGPDEMDLFGEGGPRGGGGEGWPGRTGGCPADRGGRGRVESRRT